MKTQLIMLDTPIIVSDEEITKLESGTSYYDGEGNIRKWSTGNMYNIYSKKIIAGIEGLPKIDWNGLEDKFGWVDVEKLSYEAYPVKIYDEYTLEDDNNEYRYLWYKGFKKAQSLNKNKFSLDDMKEAYHQGWYDKAENKVDNRDKFIKSLQQPKVFNIEVEMEVDDTMSVLDISDDYPYIPDDKPKITNNSIKILKKL